MMATSSNDIPHPHQRVILLLDMDCFYAQCEMVRLNIPRHVPLALLQWNTALAVNYAARDKYQIKRGDTFESIMNKSHEECVSIHLPVTPVNDCDDDNIILVDDKVNESEQRTIMTAKSGMNAVKDNDEVSENRNESFAIDVEDDIGEGTNNECGGESFAIQDAYDKEFNQPQHIRAQMYKLEKNKMRYPSEGKANLNRYRVASSRIFSLIYETLVENLGKENFIMERASIDELFIDVTSFCYKTCLNRPISDCGEVNLKDVVCFEDNSAIPDTMSTTSSSESSRLAKFLSDCDQVSASNLIPNETVVCHRETVDFHEMNSEIGRALRRGCYVSFIARRVVLDTLGFTLSAGISTNKLVSKLAASYGKPNGQAVIYPCAMPKVMEETQIRKARMLGGKLGKKVQSLLPENETTMGSISRLMSLNQLENALGNESARWVFDACRGIDYEDVKATLKVLPKSITAFKSFQKVSYPELEKWTTLLARDIMKRVEIDNERNNRLPKSVTVGYTMIPGGPWIGHSFRLPFPTEKDFNLRVQKLVDNTRSVLQERKHTSFIRIGFSAVDFVLRPKKGIDSFFCKGRNSLRQSSNERPEINENDDSTCKKSGCLDQYFTSNPNRNEVSNMSTQTKLSSVAQIKHATSITMTNDGVSRYRPDRLEEGHPESIPKMSSITNNDVGNFTDEDIARQLQETYNNEHAKNIAPDTLEKDLAIASQLQSEYDRENAILSRIERFSPKGRHVRTNNDNYSDPKINKRSKIDYFFSKSKK